jgi:hypothetical protein
MSHRSPSLYIGQKAAQTNYYAVKQAERIGLPLSHFVTINFSMTKIDPHDAVPCFSKLRRYHFNKWATRPHKGKGPAFTPTYAFAFENVRDKAPFLTMERGEPHNVHVHWALHLPPSRVHEFRNEIWDWLRMTAGEITGGDEAINVLPLTDLSYLLKGTTPTLARLYARGRDAEPQGIIMGRRADTSRNLGPTARRARDKQLGIQRRMPSRYTDAAQPSPP